MAAVRPTPEEPRPVVLTASGATFMMARSSWLFATPGSPTWDHVLPRLRAQGTDFRSPAPAGML